MRILYMTDFDLSLDDGPGINEREFVMNFIASDRVEAQCLLRQPRYAVKLPRSSKIHFFSSRSPGARGLLRYQWDLFRQGKRLALDFKPDFILIRSMIIDLAPLWISRATGVPLVLKTVGKYLVFGEKHRSIPKRLFLGCSRSLFKRVLTKAAFYDTPSPTYADWLSQKFSLASEKLAVIPNHVNTAMFHPMAQVEARSATGMALNKKIVGYVGALDKLRNLDRVVKAAKTLASRYTPKELQFVLVGDGSLRKTLETSVSDEGLGAYFLFTGKVPYEDVPKWMCAFDVALDITFLEMVVSPEKPPLYGSFSQKISQYLACGRPVVGIACPDNTFIEEEKLGWLVGRKEPDTLNQVIDQVISMSEAERSALFLRCSDYAARHLSAAALLETRIRYWESIVKPK